MRDQRVTVFGGSGFLGRYLVRRLADADARVVVAVRDPEAAQFLKPMGRVGQIVPTPVDVTRPDTIVRALEGADAAVNLVGILYERGRRTFEAVHVRGAGTIARAASEAGARRLVHISAIGADAGSPAAYARSKARGEVAVREAFPSATVIRPSIVFGPEDDFFNRFGALARYLPALPLIGGGGNLMQPVYVGDVADAIAAVLADAATAGKTYELGGPKIFTFKELMELVLRETRRRRLLIPVPWTIARLQARFLELLPVPPLTVDQVKLLEIDNVVSEGALGLADLGIEPTPVGAVLPGYMRRHRREG